MGIKKISFYHLSLSPETVEASESIPITFDSPLESWAFSVALTKIDLSTDSEAIGEIVQIFFNMSAYVTLYSSSHPDGKEVTHGTSEEYGHLSSFVFCVDACCNIKVDALLTLYEFEPKEYTRVERPPIEPPGILKM